MFQFHTGSITAQKSETLEDINRLFQFHTGSITAFSEFTAYFEG